MSKIKPLRNGTKKELITKKAAALFRRKGYSSSSMRELAEQIGVEAPSLYNHIGSKGELLNEICFSIAEEYREHLQNVLSSKIKIVNKLEEIIHFHIQLMITRFDAVFVVNHEWKQLKDPHLTEFINQRKSYESHLLQLIEEGIQKKELKKINPSVAVLTILSAVRGLEIWQRHKNNLPAEELEKQMIQHLLTGIIK